MVPKKGAKRHPRSGRNAKTSKQPKMAEQAESEACEAEEQNAEESADELHFDDLLPKKGAKRHASSGGNAKASKQPKTSESEDTNGEENDEDEEDKDYEVEEIVGSRIVRGQMEYKIRWRGFGEDDDTWEGEANLDCPDLIKQYNESQKNLSLNGKKKGRKASSSKAKASSKSKEPVGDENTEWEVLKIIDYMVSKDGSRQFRIRWKGFKASDDTWEPESNLNCKELIKSYMADQEKLGDWEHDFREERKQVDKYTPRSMKHRHSGRSVSKKMISYHDME